MIQRQVPWRAAALIALSLVVTACGANARLQMYRVNVVALNTARDVVLVLSKEREAQLYASCNPPSCTKEVGYGRVEEWQKKVDAVVEAIDLGYRAQHDAVLLDDGTSAAKARAAFIKAMSLVKELKELKEKP